jgi:phosphate transport system substrate-binding protein
MATFVDAWQGEFILPSINLRRSSMKRKVVWLAMGIVTILASWAGPLCVSAQEKLRYSCSAQVYEAFEKERLEAFTKATGIEVDLYVSSSAVALNRLLSGDADLASIARGGRSSSRESGYQETPFIRDSLAIIVNARNHLNNLTEEQLRDIFCKKITNWKQLNGPDETILLVIPGKATAAYENFKKLALKRKDIPFDIMTNQSTLALEVVKRLPATISFVTQGAVAKSGGAKTIRVNGLSPNDKGYPYFQEFSFVTKEKPAVAAKAFIDFACSDNCRDLIKKRGMVPIGPKE